MAGSADGLKTTLLHTGRTERNKLRVNGHREIFPVECKFQPCSGSYASRNSGKKNTKKKAPREDARGMEVEVKRKGVRHLESYVPTSRQPLSTE